MNTYMHTKHTKDKLINLEIHGLWSYTVQEIVGEYEYGQDKNKMKISVKLT